MKNIESINFNIENLCNKLYPICFFTEEKKDLFRNKEMLLKILRNAIPSLDKFYNETEDKELNQRGVL